ncbi:MAG: ABC-2 transporter permease [Ruminococcus sp.]|nr:ABC-2 transporter permease [Ruminococcus sp.]
MKNLLYKEYMLAVHPLFFLFILMGAMMLIPDYCYYVAFIYSVLVVINNIFTSGKANKDIEYTTLLPIKKSDAVKARFLSVCVYELANILSAGIFAVVSHLVYGSGLNQAGIDINPAFFGFVFVMFGGFNFIYLTEFYKTGHKILKPILFAGGFFMLFIGVAETLAQYIQSPVSAYLDSSTPEGMLMQIPVLIAGIVLFVLLNLWGFKVSAKRFERLDL